MSEKIQIEGKNIAIQSIDDKDYISLTDMVRGERTSPGRIISNWLRLRNTLELIELWEGMNNPSFKVVEFDNFYFSQVGKNTFSPGVGSFIKETGAICLKSRQGRGGGTFAHRDIAFAFGAWISPKFQLLLIQEFQRLKSEEYQRNKLEWDTSRFLSKINYSLQTNAIQKTSGSLKEKDKGGAYASEADLINDIVFGMTAKEWKIKNPDVKGNLRDHAGITQLIILSNLETHNSYLILAGASIEARYHRLKEIAESQFEIFSRDKRLNDGKKFLE